MTATVNQKWRLRQLGVSEDKLANMTFQEASQIISENSDSKLNNPSPPEKRSTFPTSPYKKDFKPDNSKTMYVSYAKDICLLLVGKLPQGTSVTDTVLQDLMRASVRAVKAGIAEFEK